MILRAIILFLLFIMIMAMIQKALRPGKRGSQSAPKALDRLRCPTCKRINYSDNPAPCERQDCRYR